MSEDHSRGRNGADDELREHHEVTASDGQKDAVVQLLESFTEMARDLPEYRYDVHIEIEECRNGSHAGTEGRE